MFDIKLVPNDITKKQFIKKIEKVVNANSTETESSMQELWAYVLMMSGNAFKLGQKYPKATLDEKDLI